MVLQQNVLGRSLLLSRHGHRLRLWLLKLLGDEILVLSNIVLPSGRWWNTLGQTGLLKIR